MNINWYPGHMKKTKDLIVENLKIIDLVIEILDARIPLSSKNPDISELAKNKQKIVVLNKLDGKIIFSKIKCRIILLPSVWKKVQISMN